MKKNKKINKIKKIILILLLILLIIFFIIKIITGSLEKEGRFSKENYINDEEEVIEYLNQRVIPRNIKVLNKYQGNVKNDNLYKKMQDLVNLLVDIDNNQESLDKYFKENEKTIEALFGKIDFEEFKFIANKKFNITGKFKYAKLIEETSLALDNAFSVEILLNFEPESEMKFKVYIQNEATNTQEDIIFEIKN